MPHLFILGDHPTVGSDCVSAAMALVGGMRFVPGQRRVHLSVGELANFHFGPRSGDRGGGRWRLAVGAEAHRQVQSEVPDDPKVCRRAEVPIEGTLLAGRWSLCLRGRVDLIESDVTGTRVIEFKTVVMRLPCDASELQREYPAYFDQLAVYLVLAKLGSTQEHQALAQGGLGGELWFECLGDGFRQRLAMSAEEAEARVAARLCLLEPYLEQHWSHVQRLREVPFLPAFSAWREGQAEAQAALQAAPNTNVLFEAPTGFGKTGIALQDALQRLQSGEVARVLFLTGKSTGQVAVERQIGRMRSPEGALRVMQLRSRHEHARVCPHACEGGQRCRQFTGRCDGALPSPDTVLDESTPSLETLATLAAASGHCPYDWSRALLPLADVWICDYNYVFSPAPARILQEVAGYDPGASLLIVDEAHNLPDRVAANHSFELTADGVGFLAGVLADAAAPSPLMRALEALQDVLAGLRPSERMDDSLAYELLDALEEVSQRLVKAPLDWDALGPLAEQVFGLADAARALAHPQLDRLLYAPERGHCRCAVLEAAPVVAEGLRTFRRSVLMSATLHPRQEFLARCGLRVEETCAVLGEAPWRQSAYRVAVDLRVDTRLRARASHYETTASTLCRAATLPPVAVFFPSFHYAETLRAYVEALDAGLRVAMQPRVRELSGQLTFIEESLLSAHLLFFVLGSSFSEGIDHLGGRVQRAVVVGPALPEVNAEQRARMERLGHLGQGRAFDAVYLAPAMRKVNQALGRLVRAPGQQASVLLHGQRYARLEMQNRLLPEYREGTMITSEEQLCEWWRTAVT